MLLYLREITIQSNHHSVCTLLSTHLGYLWILSVNVVKYKELHSYAQACEAQNDDVMVIIRILSVISPMAVRR